MQRGFTLIELMMALIVVAILAALAWPSYAAYLRQGRRMEGELALVNRLQQEQQYFAEHHSYVEFSADAPQAVLPWWSGSAPSSSAYELRARPCEGQPLTQCVLVEAIPGTGRVDASFRDPDCGTLSLQTSGERDATGPAARCWP
jgi:type IV pilus assembly protein PilE